MKTYDLIIENRKYTLELKILNDSLIIKAIEDNINLNNIFEKELSLKEIYKINEKYKECKCKEDLLNNLYNDIFLVGEKEIKVINNYLIIINNNSNIEIIINKIKKNEEEIFDDIFNNLESLENQINIFTKKGQELTDKLQNNLNHFGNIISDYKKENKI